MSPDKIRIINKMYQDSSIKESIRYFSRERYNDFFGFFWEKICQMPEDRLKKAEKEGWLTRLAGSIIINNLNSSTSRFYRLYHPIISNRSNKKELQEHEMWGIIESNFSDSYVEFEQVEIDIEEEIFPEEEIERDKIDTTILLETKLFVNSLPLYENTLWRLRWEEGLSMREISEKTTISYDSIYYNLNKSMKALRIHLELKNLYRK